MAGEFDISNTSATGFAAPKDDTLNSFAQLLNISGKAAAMDARQQGLDIRAAQLGIQSDRLAQSAELANYKNEMAPANNARNAVWSELGATKNPDGRWATQLGADGVDTGMVMFDKARKQQNDDAAARTLSGDSNMTWDALPSALKDKRKEQLISYTGFNEKTGQNADLKRQVDGLYGDYVSIEKLQKKQSERGFGAVTDTLLSALSSGIGLASDVTALAGVGVGMAGTWLGADSVSSMAKVLYGAAEAAKGVTQSIDSGKTAQGQKQARDSAEMMKQAAGRMEAGDYAGMAKFATNAFMNDGTGSIGMLLGSFVGSGLIAKGLAKAGVITAERAGLTAGIERFGAELGKIETRGAVAGATALEQAAGKAATAMLNTGNAMPGIMSATLAGGGTSVLDNREALTKGFAAQGLTGQALEEAVTRGAFEAAMQAGLMSAAVTMLMPGKYAETFFTGGVRQRVTGELSATGMKRMQAAMSRGGTALKEAVFEASEETMDEGFSSGKSTTKNQQAILDGKGSNWWSFDGPAATQGFIGGGLTGGSVRLVSREGGHDKTLPETAPSAPENIKGDTIEMPDLTGAINQTFGLSGTTAFTMSKYANMAEKGDWSFINDFTAQQMELHKDAIAGSEDQFRAHIMESVGQGLNIPGLVDAGQLGTAVTALTKQLDAYATAHEVNTPGKTTSGTAFEAGNKAIETANALINGALANDGTMKISPEDIAKVKQLSTAVLLATNEQKVQSYSKRGGTKSLEFQKDINSASEEKLAQMEIINKDNAPYLTSIKDEQAKRAKSETGDPIAAAQVVIDWFTDPATDEPARMKFVNETDANVKSAATKLSQAAGKDAASPETAKARREYIRQLTIQSGISTGTEVSYAAVDTSVLTGMLKTYNKALAASQKTPTGIIASNKMIEISNTIGEELQARADAGQMDPTEAAAARAESAAAAKAAKANVEGNVIVDSAVEQAGLLLGLAKESDDIAKEPRAYAVGVISKALSGPHWSEVLRSMTDAQKAEYAKYKNTTGEDGAVKGTTKKDQGQQAPTSLADYSQRAQAALIDAFKFDPAETEAQAIGRLKKTNSETLGDAAVSDQTIADAHFESYKSYVESQPSHEGISKDFFIRSTLDVLGGDTPYNGGARVNPNGKSITEREFLQQEGITGDLTEIYSPQAKNDTRFKAQETLKKAVLKAGGIARSEARDLTGEPWSSKIPQAALFTENGRSLEDIIAEGSLNSFLPENLRSDVINDPNKPAPDLTEQRDIIAGFLSDKGLIQTYDAKQEAQRIADEKQAIADQGVIDAKTGGNSGADGGAGSQTGAVNKRDGSQNSGVSSVQNAGTATGDTGLSAVGRAPEGIGGVGIVQGASAGDVRRTVPVSSTSEILGGAASGSGNVTAVDLTGVISGFTAAMNVEIPAFESSIGLIAPEKLTAKDQAALSNVIQESIKSGIPSSLVERVLAVGKNANGEYFAAWDVQDSILIIGPKFFDLTPAEQRVVVSHELGHVLDSYTGDDVGKFSQKTRWTTSLDELAAWYAKGTQPALNYPFGNEFSNLTRMQLREESFPQAVMLYAENPDALRDNAPSAYEFIRKEIDNESRRAEAQRTVDAGAGGSNQGVSSLADAGTTQGNTAVSGVGSVPAISVQGRAGETGKARIVVPYAAIQEEAASLKKQRANPPNKDQMARQAAINAAIAKGPASVRELGKRILDTAEGGALKAKRFFGQFLTLDALVNLSGTLFQDKNGNNLLQAINRARKVERSALDHNIERLSGTVLKSIRELAAKSQFKAVNDLVNLSAYEDFAPDKNVAPISDAQKQMSTQWKALNPAQKAAYKQIREEYKSQYGRIKAAMLNVAKDLTGDIATELKKAIDNRNIENYFALTRIGDYYNIVKDSNDKVVWYSKVNSFADAKAQADSLAKNFPADQYKVSQPALVSEGLSRERTTASARVVNSMSSELTAKGYSEQQIQSIVGLFEDAVLAADTKQNANALTKRQYILGASTNAAQSTLGAMQSMERLIAYTENGRDVASALKAAKEHVDKTSINNPGYNKAAAQVTLDEFNANINQRTTDNKLSAAASSFGFVSTMFGSVASAALQVSGLQVLGVPILGARFGFVNAQKEITASLGKAGLSIGKFALTSDAYTESERRFRDNEMSTEDRAQFTPLYYAKKNGLVDLNATNNFLDAAQSTILGDPTTQLGRLKEMTYDRAKAGLGWPLQKAELLTSLAAFTAAFNLEARRVGLYKMAPGSQQFLDTEAKVYQFAGDQKNLINFDGTAANKARFAKTSIGRPVMLLRSYGINMGALLYADAKTVLSQAQWKNNPAEAKLAAKRLGGIIGMHAIIAGKSGLPFIVYQPLMLAALAIGGGSGDEEKDKELANLPLVDRFQNMLTETFGDDIANYLMNGVLGGGVSGRITLDKLVVQGDNRNAFGLPGKPGDVALNMLGPGFANAITLGFKATDDPAAVGKYAPGAVSNLVKAWALASNDNKFVSSKGNEVQLSPTDVFMQTIGFRPDAVARLTNAEQALSSATQIKGKAETKTLDAVRDEIKSQTGRNVSDFNPQEFTNLFLEMYKEQAVLHEENWKPIEPSRIKSYVSRQIKNADQSTDPRSDTKKAKDAELVPFADRIIARGL